MDPVDISSHDNPLLVRLRRLARDPAAYRKLGLVWLEGDHLGRALRDRGRRASHCVIAASAWDDATIRQLASVADRAVRVTDALFAELSALESPARVGFVLPLQPAPGVRAGVASVVLDRVQDAGNVGSILRSAAAFAVPQVVALKGTAALWSPKVLRAGMGAHFALELVEGATPDSLRALGLPLLATSSHGGEALQRAPLPWPCAWVFGHEGQGVSPDLLDLCSSLVRIEQPGGGESINVAAAAAVCLYESSRRRSP